jgi:hypothetical protein
MAGYDRSFPRAIPSPHRRRARAADTARQAIMRGYAA